MAPACDTAPPRWPLRENYHYCARALEPPADLLYIYNVPQVPFQRRLRLHKFRQTSIKHVSKQTFLSTSKAAANVDSNPIDCGVIIQASTRYGLFITPVCVCLCVGGIGCLLSMFDSFYSLSEASSLLHLHTIPFVMSHYLRKYVTLDGGATIRSGDAHMYPSHVLCS